MAYLSAEHLKWLFFLILVCVWEEKSGAIVAWKQINAETLWPRGSSSAFRFAGHAAPACKSPVFRRRCCAHSLTCWCPLKFITRDCVVGYIIVLVLGTRRMKTMTPLLVDNYALLGSGPKEEGALLDYNWAECLEVRSFWWLISCALDQEVARFCACKVRQSEGKWVGVERKLCRGAIVRARKCGSFSFKCELDDGKMVRGSIIS